VDTHDPSSALDGWLIGRLRAEPRASRLGELLFDDQTAAARIEELEALVLELQAQLPSPPSTAAGHLLFRSTAHGYELRELAGPPPRQGDPVLLDGTRYHVERIGRSPLPGDRRPCLYLEAE
jgi:hypothetical protein